MNNKYFLLALLLTLLTITSTYYTQQEERTLQPQLTRDQSLFPLPSTGIWTEVHPLIPRVDYWGVDFVNADTGWAVGEGGAVIKTTNGGQKWIWFESGVENTLRTVASVNNGQRVITAGDGGIIIISEDAGETWNTLPSGTTDNIWNVQMITEEIGWMVGEGGTALRTSDGGLTWIQQPMPYPNLAYWDVSFVDTSFGYICCNTAIVLKTTNGGGSWQIQQAGDTRSLYTIFAFDTLKASAGGFAGKVVYTTDGGSSWINVNGLSAAAINRIKFINDVKGYLASSGGFYESTNTGVSWTSIGDLTVSGIVPITTNLSFPTESKGYVTGDKMLIAKTNDTGESWRKTIVNTDFINVYFKDEQNGFINSGNLIYNTNDGGYTLDTLLTFPYNNIYELEGMAFTDSLTGYAGTLPTRIYKTVTGGQNWYRTNITGLTDTGGVIKKFFFLTNNIGWAIKGNQIIKTTDSGESWFVQQNIPGTLTSIFFVDSLIGWATGYNVKPYKTIDGGVSWIEQINSNIIFSRDVYFKNCQEGFIVRSNIFYLTTDSGATWSQDSSFSGFGFARFSNYDVNNIFLTGNKVYRTTNGGNIWIEFSEIQGQGLIAGYLWAINSGYFIGNTGLIIKYFDEAVPVEMINFNGSLNENETIFQWTTATEINNKGFYIQRKRLGEIEWSEISFIEGKGNSTELNSYFYKDILREAGTYFYRLKQTDFNGAYEYSKEIEINFISPSKFKIMPNFPNPFNPTTNVRIILPEESFITIKIFNVLGELIKTIITNEFQAGIFDLEINLSGLSSGVYFYNVTAQGRSNIIFSKTNKMTLTK